MVAEIVFLIILSITFGFAILGRKHTPKNEAVLSDHRLNKWLVGLSAGATANSGFVVTGAVGLGYLYGYKWLLLPLGWFLGDLLFWKYFPGRLNAIGHRIKATSISDVLVNGLDEKYEFRLRAISTLLIIVCLCGYTTAQWLAGQKILAGAFKVSENSAVTVFALLVIAYSSIGGFKGSVYADTFQATIRIFGSTLALVTVAAIASEDLALFTANLHRGDVDPNFLSPLGDLSLMAALAFVCGYVFTSLGFGLGQPQITTRYLAGVSPAETDAAKWIYIAYVQFTWVSMTIFGILLRGVMPGIEDPEQGFGIFFQSYFPGLIAGIVIADIFAAMASTSNSLLVTMSQSLLSSFPGITKRLGKLGNIILITVLGIISLLVSLRIDASVVDVALTSVSLLAAGVAPAVMIKVLQWRHSGLSLLAAICSGFLIALLWIYVGWSKVISEAAPGILTGLAVNYIVIRIQFRRGYVSNERLVQ